MNFQQFLGALRGRLAVFLGVLAVTVLATAVVSLLLPKTYKTTVSLLVDAKDEYGWPPARLVVVHVMTDGATVLARLRQRNEPRDEWKIRNWEQFWAGSIATACCVKRTFRLTPNPRRCAISSARRMRLSCARIRASSAP